MENENPDKLTEAPAGTDLSGGNGMNHEQACALPLTGRLDPEPAAGPRNAPAADAARDAHATPVKQGDIVEATVKRIAPFGAFVRLADGSKGLVHISQIDDAYVTEIREHLKVGDNIRAKVLAIGEDGRIDLSIKKAKKKPVAKKAKPRPTAKARPGSGFKITPFEEAFNKKLNVTLES